MSCCIWHNAMDEQLKRYIIYSLNMDHSSFTFFLFSLGTQDLIACFGLSQNVSSSVGTYRDVIYKKDPINT